ncbi:MAG TPA: hypothetical protein VGZ91_19965 [Candidatus Sulfotelmatobacter sp.]|jgi:hypothetical protein|nr:hypothetical protein [Candidatus Sulfotelmatobacter sp.]
MYLPTKAQLETAGAVIGIAGPSLTALKTSIGYVRDHSLERRRLKTLEALDLCLKRLSGAREERAAFPSLQLCDDYEKEVREELESLSQTLLQIRAGKANLERRKFEDPEGTRKWLLLYKPEGVDGWISQTFFYGIAFPVFVALAMGIYMLLARHDRDAPLVLGVGLVYSALAYYFWSLSLRLKHAGNAQRRGELGKLNSDLGWLSKLLLLFRVGSWGQNIARFFYYVFLFDGIFGWFVFRDDPELKGWGSRLGLSCACLVVAEVLRADLLVRRGLRVASRINPVPRARIGN